MPKLNETPEPMAAPPRLCVFTTLIGGYEALNEQPVSAHCGVPFICLTDDPGLTSHSWRTVVVPRMMPEDPVREQRALKIRPEAHLPDCDISLYIDNSVLLTATPTDIFRAFAGAELALPRHSDRASLADEFREVARLGLDEGRRIDEQFDAYQRHQASILGERPYWTGILLRDHRSPRVRRFEDIWLAHVMRHSRRDQLSANVALAAAGLAPAAIEIDNRASWFHSWPHVDRRDERRRVAEPEPAAASLLARLVAMESEGREMRGALDASRATIDAMASSTSWRITAPARWLMRCLRGS